MGISTWKQRWTKGFLSIPDAEKLVDAFIFSRPDYCFGVFTGLNKEKKRTKNMQDLRGAYEASRPLRWSGTGLSCVPRNKVKHHVFTMPLACGPNSLNTRGLFKVYLHLNQGWKQSCPLYHSHESLLYSLILIPISCYLICLDQWFLTFWEIPNPAS